MHEVVIAGASLAGLSAATAIRRTGFGGSIVVLEAEDELPPDRPALSKQVLSGEWPIERASQPGAATVHELDLDIRFGCRATGFDAQSRALTVERFGPDGLSIVDDLHADGLVIATGARPRPMPAEWAAMPGVHTIRTRADTVRLLADIERTTGRVLIVGAGVIGLEAASSLRQRDRDVTVIESMPTPLMRVLSAEVGERIAQMHRNAGVDLRTGVSITEMLGTEMLGTEMLGGSRFGGARLSDGSVVEADVAVVGIGVVPNTEWLRESAIALDDSGAVVCDATCAAMEGVVAAGDVASFVHTGYDERMRVEHWDTAIEMGSYAGARLMTPIWDDHEPYTPVPFFWSDQLGSKVQAVGRIHPGDEWVMLDGSISDDRFVMAFRHGDRVGAVLSMNRPAPVIRYRMRMATAEGVAWSEVAT